MEFQSLFNSNYGFSTDLREISPYITGCEYDVGMCCSESFPFRNGVLDVMLPETDTSSSDFHASFPDCFGVPATNIDKLTLPEYDTGLCCLNSVYGGASMGNQSVINTGFLSESHSPEFSEKWERPESCELAEKWETLISAVRPVYSTGDYWAIHGNSSSATIEQPCSKVGRYSTEERKSRIMKYLKKRNQRNFNKTIKYACRKTLAERRVRVRGRFARNDDSCDEAMMSKNNINFKEEEDYYEVGPQIEQNREEWLQQAMASLMHLPISSG